MTAIQLDLPPQVYAQLERNAKEHKLSVEALLTREISLLADYRLPTLSELESYTEDQLAHVVSQPFNPLYKEQLTYLMALHNDGQLSEAQHALLHYLADCSSDYAMVRAKALGLLKAQGHDISQYLGHS